MSMGQYETTKVKVANIFFLFFPTLPPRIALCTLPGVELLGKRRGRKNLQKDLTLLTVWMYCLTDCVVCLV